MQWIAPSQKDSGYSTLEKRLWDAADQFRANSGLKAAEYSQPVLGLIFLRFAEVRFAAQRARLEKLPPRRDVALGWMIPPHTMPRSSCTLRPKPATTICSRFPGQSHLKFR